MEPEDTDQIVDVEPKDDIRSLIDAAFVEQESPPEISDAPVETRTRGPDGKFARAEPKDEAAIVTEPSEVAPSEVKTTPTVAEPPATWKAEDKETFKTLPPEAQQVLLRRHGEMEADYSRKTQARAAFDRDYEPVRQILAPHEAQIRAAGFTPATLIKAWSDVETSLASNPIAILTDIVQKYKVDRTALGRALGLSPAPSVEGQPPPVDGAAPIVLPPEVANTLQTLQQRQTQIDQYFARQQEAQANEAANRAMSTVTTFREAKDDKGVLLHPHFDEVEAQMAQFAESARVSNQPMPPMDELYEQAVWANTSTRQKMLDGQRAAEQAQRDATLAKERTEARAKAERARKAGSSVTGAPGHGQAAQPSQTRNGEASLRDTLLGAFEDVSDNAA